VIENVMNTYNPEYDIDQDNDIFEDAKIIQEYFDSKDIENEQRSNVVITMKML